jgi:hypothetical protein
MNVATQINNEQDELLYQIKYEARKLNIKLNKPDCLSSALDILNDVRNGLTPDEFSSLVQRTLSTKNCAKTIEK